MSFICRQWFLVGLLGFLSLGITLGRQDSNPWLASLVHRLPTLWCTGGILFLMSVMLDTGKLMRSLRRPYAVLTACAINMICLPLMCLPLLSLQQTPALRVGLLIAAAVPCTMAAASVWTRRAEGNDAVALLVSLLTNGFCFILTPAWMELGRAAFRTADTSDAISFEEMMIRLTVAALLPAILGQAVRIQVRLRTWVDSHRRLCSNLTQLFMLSLVFISSFKGGQTFDVDRTTDLSLQALLIVWASCVALHLAAAGLGWTAGGWFGYAEGDRRAIVIAGSQKTLPIGLLVSEATGMPLSIVPILMFHASQLFVDTWIAGRMQKRVCTDPSSE